jgi:hypothetical protein
MPKKQLSCPNCDSEFCSAIQYWRPARQIVKGTFDAFKCHDCGYFFEAGTKKELPKGWQPKRKVAQSQPDLFGNVANIRDTVNIVPKLVESPAGLTVAVSYIPEGSTQQYKDEVRSMMLEINKSNTGRDMPHWYKYRNIKRRKK